MESESGTCWKGPATRPFWTIFQGQCVLDEALQRAVNWLPGLATRNDGGLLHAIQSCNLHEGFSLLIQVIAQAG